MPTGDEVLRFEPDYGDFDEAVLVYDGGLKFETRDKDSTDRFIKQRLVEDWQESDETGSDLGERILE